MNEMRENNVLHLFSGGRDSFLATGLLVENGYSVKLITYNNGHINDIDRVKESAEILCSRYSGKVEFVGIHNTAMTMQSFLRDMWTQSMENISVKYPKINICQMNCMGCKLSMYIHSVAYCKAKDIHYISDGTRKSQGFFVDTETMRTMTEKLLRHNDIELVMPLYDLESDYERKVMLDNRGLPTKTLEPQCFLGVPLQKELDLQHIVELKNLYEEEIESNVQKVIDELVRVKSID